MATHCKTCRGGRWTDCADPQCGDSTWDHHCTKDYERCTGLDVEALRESAARLEMVRRWSEKDVPYFDGWGDLRDILNGTTPIPADLRGGK